MAGEGVERDPGGWHDLNLTVVMLGQRRGRGGPRHLDDFAVVDHHVVVIDRGSEEPGGVTLWRDRRWDPVSEHDHLVGLDP